MADGSTAALVLQSIATTVAVAKFLISKDLATTVENIRAYFSKRDEPMPKELTTPGGVALVQLLVIDPDLLDELDKQTRDGVSAYIKCLQRAQRRQEKDRCDRLAEKDVCDTLNRIRDRNDGELPTDYLEDQWKSFGCVR